MGGCHSDNKHLGNDKDHHSSGPGTLESSGGGEYMDEVQQLQKKFRAMRDRIPMEVIVAHYTPHTFPLIPRIDTKTCKVCAESWGEITNAGNTDSFGVTTSGLTIFYTEFYERLDLVDTSGKFEAILSRYASGSNKIAAKGTIIVRIVKYVASITKDSRDVQFKLYMLGKHHARKQVRPWQYGLLAQVILQTVSSRLGTKATNEVMSAWVNMLAFVMRSMIPPAIEDLVVENEMVINTSSEFQSGKIAEEVQEVEEVRVMKQKMNRALNGSEIGSQHGGDLLPPITTVSGSVVPPLNAVAAALENKTGLLRLG